MSKKVERERVDALSAHDQGSRPKTDSHSRSSVYYDHLSDEYLVMYDINIL